jgi:hypothetical protein
MSADGGIEITRTYGCGVRWRVYAVLRRPLDRGTYILSPGHKTRLKEREA